MSETRNRFELLDKPTVISQFKYSNNITSIHPTEDGHAWISDSQSKTIVLVDNKGTVKRRVSHRNSVADISIALHTNHLWFCCLNDKTVYEVPTTSDEPFKRFKTDDEPFYLCVTKEGNIVVGSEFKVTIYDENGVVLHQTTRDVSGIVSPASIAQCPVTGNIAVVNGEPTGSDTDSINSWRSHIIVFDKTLGVMFQYRGEGIKDQEPTATDLFGPNSISYDSFGNLAIADYKTYTVELISGTGQFIRTLNRNSREQGSIGIGTGNVLWTELESDSGDWIIQLMEYYKD
ncbi:uncharacterized protein LOC110443803 [Mizuhopecten yessoensis]|uniref:Uncharacterized protein n=1 Tax=Mizuhopecten yessoensis TaxID=6573 RepID=A0A210PE72_MIZYE|nr:uncharacterized protein LOC110443803 [Mizuhopecten yessoensis]OWF34756.1 hypothetical protein KP79_PYT14154 [Mizuhopecten yessoensis]